MSVVTNAPENPYANAAPAGAPLSPGEEKQWAMLDHLLSIFFGIIPALVFFFMYKDRGPFVRAHTVTEWNFQLTLLIFQVGGFLIAFLSIFASFATIVPGTQTGPPAGVGLFFVGYLLVLAVRFVAIVFGIVAARATSRGLIYRYPLAIPFVK